MTEDGTTERRWYGYGPPGIAEQWRMAAELLECEVLHGPALDDLPETGPVDPIAVTQRCVTAIMDAADRLAAGETVEACCYDRQRRNRGDALAREGRTGGR